MSKMLMLFAMVATLVLSTMAFTATNAVAISPSQQECEASGGTFSRDQGTVTCTFPTVFDPVGNSEKSGGKSQETETNETKESNGTLKNKPKNNDSSSCTGPGNGGSTAQCG